MTVEAVIVLLFSFGLNAVALWGAFRRKRTEVVLADAQADGAIEDGAIGRWQAFCARLEAKIDGLERARDASTAREMACAELTARQGEQIRTLTAAVRNLRADLKRAGINPGSGPHEPLSPLHGVPMLWLFRLKNLAQSVTALAAKFPESQADAEQLFADVEHAVLTRSWTIDAVKTAIADAEKLVTEFAAEWAGSRTEFVAFAAAIKSLFI